MRRSRFLKENLRNFKGFTKKNTPKRLTIINQTRIEHQTMKYRKRSRSEYLMIINPVISGPPVIALSGNGNVSKNGLEIMLNTMIQKKYNNIIYV